MLAAHYRVDGHPRINPIQVPNNPINQTIHSTKSTNPSNHRIRYKTSYNATTSIYHKSVVGVQKQIHINWISLSYTFSIPRRWLLGKSTSTWCSLLATVTCTATFGRGEDSGSPTLATSSDRSSPPSTRRTSRASCSGISSSGSSSSPTSQGKSNCGITSRMSNYDVINTAAFCLYSIAFI